MASLPSGSRNSTKLLVVETEEFTLIIKGRPYHYRYEGFKQYRKMNVQEKMDFSCIGDTVTSVLLFNVDQEALTENTNVKPIFFENGVYDVIIAPKNKDIPLQFYHESPLLRRAIVREDLPGTYILAGSLTFQNEIGYSTFEVRRGDDTLLEVTLEVFPEKLDYQNDYKQLLEEVNDEIYNLAYYFIRKTYLGANIKLDGNPSRAEFYRLISKHFQQFMQSINRIERQPHHKLETTYVKARGDELSQLDFFTRKYLQRKGNFVEVKNGILLHGKRMMPQQGMKMKKELVYDTLENRFIKWMMQRVLDKLVDLIGAIRQPSRWKTDPDSELVEKLEAMKKELERKLKNMFWQQIGRLTQSVMRLVIQMAPGYRDAFQIYLLVTKGLTLQSRFYQMSVKDVATLYEYWTYLKIGQILSRKYTQLSQDIIRVNRNGLFVNLDTSQKAERTFEHPVTKEKITLMYQKVEAGLPTITQKPDTMLAISKKGKDFTYNYVFDAKYRIDYAQKDSGYYSRYKTPGPLEEDINTMHRYRDSLVYMNNGPYERTAFGAYILFPWGDEEAYKEHPLYRSIDQVNIGGLPFLPNATDLVEQFIERLIEKSPEEIQKEGILPRGTKEEWQSSLVEKVLVGTVSSKEAYKDFIQRRYFRISAKHVTKDWQEAKYVALYVTAEVNPTENGIADYGKVDQVLIDNNYIIFHIKGWKRTEQLIRPVKYGVASNMMTTFTQLKTAKELPELYMKSQQETILWKILRRVSNEVTVKVNHKNVDQAERVEEFSFNNIVIKLREEGFLTVIKNGFEERKIDVDTLLKKPSFVLKEVLAIVRDQ
ncbi:restriction endonuclease-like protein [Sutcliffiella sp. NC1]|nr:restriction endonuclease-like protein [Sutcliffiella sp. NC1]WBL17539.1 restriction endonuclease-like protein [Sutcliffiella sp. NC1]